MSKAAKLIFFLYIFLLALSSINAQVTPQSDFASVQAQILANIEIVNAKLDKVQSNIENSNADQSAKDQVIATINTIRTGLDSYKAKIEAATTVEDIAAIRLELRQNLIENQAVLKEQLKSAVLNVGSKVSTKVNGLLTVLDQTLNVLEKTCTSQSSNINTLEANIDELKVKGSELTSLVKNKDKVGAKAKVAEINALAKEIYSLVITIKSGCGL